MQIEVPGTEFINPGYIYFSREGSLIRSVLGSCVAVCIWDRRLRYGGIGHFLYPSTHRRQLATAKYGNVSTPVLLKMFKEAGSRQCDLEAQIIGGAFPRRERGTNVGMENVRIARRILARRGISVVSEDVGGSLGRKVIFDVSSGEIAVLKVRQVRRSDWILRLTG